MLNKIDIFGSQILLRFNGEPTYNTKFGSIVTILIIGFIGFRLFFIVEDVFQRKKPSVIYSERQVDDPAPFVATSSSFPMAFGMEDPITYNYFIDESIYTIKAQWNQKLLIFNETTQQYITKWNNVDLKVQPCTLANFQNPDNQHYYLQYNYTNMYCLPPDLDLTIQGDYPSLVYSEIKFIIQPCQTNCKSADILSYYLLKSNFAIEMSDSYVDPTLKTNPFKSYSRDMYWPTSTLMPKDVTVYIRNNYVNSDFGWFFSDITTQNFPSYSFYEASVYPANFQNYFLSLTFRFEKQKEGVYTRTYQNFNSIMSEIGGFTQSLLAIGFLICTRISQLHLNQKIINQAFNYQDSTENNQGEKEDDEIDRELEKKIRDPQQSINHAQQNQQNLIDSNMSQLKPSNLNSHYNMNLISRNGSQSHIFQNKREQDNQQSSPMIQMMQNQSGVAHSQFQSFNKIKIKQAENIDQNPSNPNEVKTSQGAGIIEGKQLPQKRNNKQILNYLIQNQAENDIETIDKANADYMNDSRQEKILKQKQKIQLMEQKLKENRFKEMMDQQTKSMKLSAWEYFKSVVYPFGELKKKKEIINYSIEKLYYNLDIFNILKRLVEVEKLKRLLLDPDQMKLFDYLPKPIINSDIALNKDVKSSAQKKYEVDVLYQDNRSEIQRARDAYQAYKKIINKQNTSLLDQKIIDLLDPNLVAVFQAQNNMIPRSSVENNVQKQNTPPLQPSPLQKSEAPYNDLHQGQELSYAKQEERFLKQDVLSPRIYIDQQPILQLSSIGEQINLKSTNEQEKQSAINIQSCCFEEEQSKDDADKSVRSEIAQEESQQLPNQFYEIKNNQPHSDSS